MFRFLQSDIRTITVMSFSSRQYKYCHSNVPHIWDWLVYGLVFQVKLVCETYDVTKSQFIYVPS